MKAIVLETEGREAAVLLRDGTIRVARGIYEVGQTFDYVSAPAHRQWIAAAAVFIAMLGLGTGWLADRNFVSYADVSLDVNPSIVYSVNKLGRVLSVAAVNADAEAIVAALDDVRFEPLSDAVTKTLSLLEADGYLDEDETDYVLMNVSADDAARREALVSQIEAALTATMESDPSIEYRIDRSDRDTAREAAAQGMSAGRYAAWQQAPETRDQEEYETIPVQRIIEAREDAPEMGDKPEAQPPTDTESQESEQPPAQPRKEAPEDREPTDGEPTDAQPTSEQPTEEAPRDEQPTGEAPQDEAPARAEPEGEAPAQARPGDEAPRDEQPTEEAPQSERREEPAKAGGGSDPVGEPAMREPAGKRA